MYISAMKSGIAKRITFIQNGVDSIRRNATMLVNQENNGGSHVAMNNFTGM